MTTTANQVFKQITKLNSRNEALELCKNHNELKYQDMTEGNADSYTDIFVFNDESELKIDTQNFAYCGDDTEMTKVNSWE